MVKNLSEITYPKNEPEIDLDQILSLIEKKSQIY